MTAKELRLSTLLLEALDALGEALEEYRNRGERSLSVVTGGVGKMFCGDRG